MTTHKIDPQLVREVLNMNDWEHEKYCDNNFRLKGEEAYNLVIDDSLIEFEDCCECYFEGLKGLDGAMPFLEEPTVAFDIHRFKDMAIEWCVKQGWSFTVEMGFVTRVIIYKLQEEEYEGSTEVFEFGDNYYYPDKLSAELAAISFVWEQMQGEKKDEN